MKRGLGGRHLDRWLGGYARHLLRRAPNAETARTAPRSVRPLRSYEPGWGDAPAAVASERVKRWAKGYPELARDFRDADGCAPQHTFFYPGEQYTPSALEQLADSRAPASARWSFTCHHDRDTAERLELSLRDYLASYANTGTFTRAPRRQPRYAFIHGNWCSPTRAATAAGAASTPSFRCCSRPAATRISLSLRARRNSAEHRQSDLLAGRRPSAIACSRARYPEQGRARVS
jgi:hypothetical protein